MTDSRIENLVRILVDYCVGVEQGHTVGITCEPFSPPALPYLLETTRQVLKAGGFPWLALRPEGVDQLILTEGTQAQLEYIDPRLLMTAREIDREIVFTCEENTHRLSGVDPARQVKYAAGLRDFYEIVNRRTAEGALRWTYTLVPTHAYAQNAEMSLTEFESFYFSSTFADRAEPIQQWQMFRTEQERYLKMFEGRDKVSLTGPNVDLTLSIKDRPFINCAGGENMPDGEVFTAPVEDSAQGWIRFTYPAVDRGREVHGVRLEFDRGKVIHATADKNEDFLLGVLDTDPGARYLGEFAIGTNYAIDRFVKNILFDEKIGGTIHIALGFGYPESGSQNVSALHWDFICDMKDGGQIRLDDELIYENGRFLF